MNRSYLLALPLKKSCLNSLRSGLVYLCMIGSFLLGVQKLNALPLRMLWLNSGGVYGRIYKALNRRPNPQLHPKRKKSNLLPLAKCVVSTVCPIRNLGRFLLRLNMGLKFV